MLSLIIYQVLLDVPPLRCDSNPDISETRNIIKKPSDDEPLSGLAFKIMNDPFRS